MGAAVDAYGVEDGRPWLRYAAWARAGGKSGGDVYWRATKALAAPEAFLRAYAEQQAAGGAGAAGA